MNKKNLVIAALVLQQVGSTAIEYDWWWKDSTNAFHFEKDGFWRDYSYGIDKFGHAYTSYLYFTAINESMRWAGFSDKSRRYTSIILPALWAISIEIGDAMAPYGFSVKDLAANFSGIAYGWLQDKYPFWQTIDFKFSYYPSTMNFNVSSNYDAHIYWLSFNIHQLLPQKLGKYWPEFINIAGGYGINGYNSGPKLTREYVIGFDLNLRAFHAKHSSINGLKSIINLFHLPLPGVKYSNTKQTEASLFLLR